MTEREYRAVPMNSSSSIKDFSVDRRKYRKKHILRETVKEKDTVATNMGRIVETLLMEEDRFDELFFMSTVVDPPGGMTGDFIYKLAELVAEHTDDEEELTVDFEELARRAYAHSGFKLTFEKVVAKLEAPENRLFYEECLKVLHLKMTLVTAQDIENAEQIVDNLKNNMFTCDIVNLDTGERYEVINQMKIVGFDVFGLQCKSMLDKVIIDHERKAIHPYDLKCTWAVENFYKDYYLYRRAYIQAFLYKMACVSLTEGPDAPYPGYSVSNLKFLVCDSINYYDPLMYTLNDDDMKDAMLGFEYRGVKYPGVQQLIEDLKWAMENDKWTISRSNFEKQGVVNIKA